MSSSFAAATSAARAAAMAAACARAASARASTAALAVTVAAYSSSMPRSVARVRSSSSQPGSRSHCGLWSLRGADSGQRGRPRVDKRRGEARRTAA